MDIAISAQIPSGLSVDKLVADMIRMEELNFGGFPIFQPEDFAQMLNGGNYTFIGAYCDGNLVGFCAGTSVDKFAKKHQVVEQTMPPNVEPAAITYVESFELLPQFQRKGIGAKLFRQFMSESHKKGFSFIAGHARQGDSYDLVRVMLKNCILVDFPINNYLGSGETYHYVLSRLR